MQVLWQVLFGSAGACAEVQLWAGDFLAQIVCTYFTHDFGCANAASRFN